MANKHTNHFNTKNTPQNQAVPGTNQVQNNAGGFVFKVSPMDQLNRFLILGSEGGSYYASEKALTVENAKNVVELIKTNGVEVVAHTVDVSDKARAPKNDPAIFVLALAATFGDAATKTASYDAISKVCRTGTHLFTFMQNVQDLRGWSRGLRKGVAKFYTSKDLDQLALQVVKYRQRNGWTHKDVLRLAHVKPDTLPQANILRFAVDKEVAEFKHELIEGFEKIQALKHTDVKSALALIKQYGLPREAIPTEFLGNVEIWRQLVTNMPMTATIRNLGKMTSVGLLKNNLDADVVTVVNRLTNPEAIKKSRVHPIEILQALTTYKQGHGDKGKLSWTPVPNIVDALDDAFYLAFGNVETTGKRHFLAIDCSGSMFGANIAGSSLTVATAAGAMAMVTLKTEPNSMVTYFNSTNGRGGQWDNGTSGIGTLDLTKKKRLDSVLETMRSAPWGGTDCALPMLYAADNNIQVDTFVVYTDNETWSGKTHPFQALKAYRKKMGIDAKLIVVGMAANSFTIADPSDKGMLDVVGFDTSTPAIMTEFSKGNI